MGLDFCSIKVWSSLIVNPQPVFELTGVIGDCHSVLFSVTTAPHEVTVSKCRNKIQYFKIMQSYKIIYLLTQHTVPKEQAPLGFPPNREHTLLLVQIPGSAFWVVQLSK